MGYDLTNSAGDYHEWKTLGWWYLLCIAQRYGWTPAGTLPPPQPEEPWDGNYFHNAGQQVTAADAAALAAALERFAADPNKQPAAEAVAADMQRAIDGPDHPHPLATDMLAYPTAFIRKMLNHFGQASVGTWRFDRKDDAYLDEFIAFCKAGAFMIE